MDDTETIEVDYEPGAKSRKTRGVCATCGEAAVDGRSTFCEQHRPEQPVGSPKTRQSKGKGRKPTSAVETGMNEVTAEVLMLLTVAYAWSALRRAGVPDPNGVNSDRMSMTAEEAVNVAKPLSRIFLSTEPGRKIAPVIVDNRDAIDAAFSLYDWYKRMNMVMEEASGRASVHTPLPRREENGNNPTATSDPGLVLGGDWNPSDPNYSII